MMSPSHWRRHLLALASASESMLAQCLTWRAYDVTQSLASAPIGVSIRVGVHVSTMFKFSKVCIVF